MLENNFIHKLLLIRLNQNKFFNVNKQDELGTQSNKKTSTNNNKYLTTIPMNEALIYKKGNFHNCH